MNLWYLFITHHQNIASSAKKAPSSPRQNSNLQLKNVVEYQMDLKAYYFRRVLQANLELLTFCSFLRYLDLKASKS